MKQIIFSCVFLICLCLSTQAQVCKGFIRNDQGQPLDGATISHAKSGLHAHANLQGAFILGKVSVGDSLFISHVGYQSSWVRVTSLIESQIYTLSYSTQPLADVIISAGVSASHIIAYIDLKTNPVNSSQELLRKVPGLFIGQHAGGGKAEQIFLRGFDIDHGTDIAISVDGIPVNMVSHAHGQGYADMHFVIPETISKMDFDKGPYKATQGNFATAGYVSFHTKEKLDSSLVALEAGRFNTFRSLGMFQLLNETNQHAYVATEYVYSNGPFESPQHFNRLNLFGKYGFQQPGRSKGFLSASHFTSQWDASGQIPQRAVDAGLISRFGAIDDTEGGRTSRTNLNLQWEKRLDKGGSLQTNAYWTNYDFELYSNFTFFLRDSVNGDQIKQEESRQIFGLSTVYSNRYATGRATVSLQAGTGIRHDQTRGSSLAETRNRKDILNQRMLGDITETNIFGFVDLAFQWRRWEIAPAIRVDQLRFAYQDQLLPFYRNDMQQKAIVSPKLQIRYAPNASVQYFLKLGRGFHSNDTRVVVEQAGRQILPAAMGADLGLAWKPMSRLLFNAAIWYLHLQQEFVYVGDEGIVEPSGRTARKGLDLGVRYQIGPSVFLQADYTFTHARALDEPKGNDYIPLAPLNTLAASLNLKHHSGWTGSVRCRYLGDRPANEDNSLIAKGYFVTDANIGYNWRQWTCGIITENIFNVDWNETQFATTSRLRNEPTEVTEIHFTPGVPFNIRATIGFRF
jgi:hypothetical protein